MIYYNGFNSESESVYLKESVASCLWDVFVVCRVKMTQTVHGFVSSTVLTWC